MKVLSGERVEGPIKIPPPGKVIRGQVLRCRHANSLPLNKVVGGVNEETPMNCFWTISTTQSFG